MPKRPLAERQRPEMQALHDLLFRPFQTVVKIPAANRHHGWHVRAGWRSDPTARVAHVGVLLEHKSGAAPVKRKLPDRCGFKPESGTRRGNRARPVHHISRRVCAPGLVHKQIACGGIGPDLAHIERQLVGRRPQAGVGLQTQNHRLARDRAIEIAGPIVRGDKQPPNGDPVGRRVVRPIGGVVAAIDSVTRILLKDL